MRSMSLAAAAAMVTISAAATASDVIVTGSGSRSEPELWPSKRRQTAAPASAYRRSTYVAKTPSSPADYERLRLAEAKRARKAAKRQRLASGSAR